MDGSVLILLLVAAFVIRQVIQAVIKPITELVNLFLLVDPTEEDLEDRREVIRSRWPFVLSFLVAGGLVYATGYNAFPTMFLSPWVGRTFTCLAGALGPSFIHDLIAGVESLNDV